MPVTNLQPVEPFQRGVIALFYVREETKFTGDVGIANRPGKSQQAFIGLLGTGHEKNAIANAAPRFRLRRTVIGQDDYLDVRFPGRSQYFLPGSTRMFGILGMNVDNGTKI